jgi:hypothetical protein
LVSGDYCAQGPKYHRISIEHARLHLDKLRIKTTIWRAMSTTKQVKWKRNNGFLANKGPNSQASAY